MESAAFVGALGWILVTNVAELVNHCAYWAASWGASSDRIEAIKDIDVDQGIDIVKNSVAIEKGSIGEWGATLIIFWSNVVTTLAAAFSVSYLWSSSTSIYLLLRRQVDAVEMDESFIDEDEQQYDLPSLEEDSAGVPGVEDEE
ncbi:unnamed protein product [marine sediment metagenome]|uniref:Uncharacterized protein n=1 Tax=marine sediment metagenome TaxID=412755 RepID=X1A4M0_9ZZZZ